MCYGNYFTLFYSGLSDSFILLCYFLFADAEYFVSILWYVCVPVCLCEYFFTVCVCIGHVMYGMRKVKNSFWPKTKSKTYLFSVHTYNILKCVVEPQSNQNHWRIAPVWQWRVRVRVCFLIVVRILCEKIDILNKWTIMWWNWRIDILSSFLFFFDRFLGPGLGLVRLCVRLLHSFMYVK